MQAINILNAVENMTAPGGVKDMFFIKTQVNGGDEYSKVYGNNEILSTHATENQDIYFLLDYNMVYIPVIFIDENDNEEKFLQVKDLPENVTEFHNDFIPKQEALYFAISLAEGLGIPLNKLWTINNTTGVVSKLYDANGNRIDEGEEGEEVYYQEDDDFLPFPYKLGGIQQPLFVGDFPKKIIMSSIEENGAQGDTYSNSKSYNPVVFWLSFSVIGILCILVIAMFILALSKKNKKN